VPLTRGEHHAVPRQAVGRRHRIEEGREGDDHDEAVVLAAHALEHAQARAERDRLEPALVVAVLRDEERRRSLRREHGEVVHEPVAFFVVRDDEDRGALPLAQEHGGEERLGRAPEAADPDLPADREPLAHEPHGPHRGEVVKELVHAP
jgi:hypothetical protein